MRLLNFLRSNGRARGAVDAVSKLLQNEVRSMLIDLQPEVTWVLDSVKLEETKLTIQGWALFKNPRSPETLTFVVNGKPFTTNTFGVFRKDLKDLFWFIPSAAQSGFVAELLYPAANLGILKELQFQLCDRQTLAPLNPNNECFWLNPSEDTLPFPDPERRARVHGSTDEQSFRITGYSSFKKMEAALTEATGKRFSDCRTMLDWGCGCGRVTRYFGKLRDTKVTGIDIDGDNIEWSKANYPFGSFAQVPLLPPTELPSAEYDLILGLSVMTHLREEAQLQWLKELHRVTAPGGILLLTVLGRPGVARAGVAESALREYRDSGFSAVGINYDLKTHVGDQEYYVNTLHSLSYIERVWGQYFDILGLKEGYIGNHQDLLVLRKK